MVRISTLLAIGSSLLFACNDVNAQCANPVSDTVANGKGVGGMSTKTAAASGAATDDCSVGSTAANTQADDTVCTFTCASGYTPELANNVAVTEKTCANGAAVWSGSGTAGVDTWCLPKCKLEEAYTHSDPECQSTGGGCTEAVYADGTPGCADNHHLTSGGELTANGTGNTGCVAGTATGGDDFTTPLTAGTCEENKCLAKVKTDWDAQFCKVSTATATTVPTLGTISNYITGGKYSKCVITCSNEATTNPDDVAFTVTPGEILCKLPVNTPHLTADCQSTGAGCTLAQLQAANMNSGCGSTYFNINGLAGATSWTGATCSPAGDNVVGTFANIERYACRTTAHPTSKSPTTKSPTTLAPTTKSPVTNAPSAFSSGPRLTGSTVSFAGAVVAGIFMLM